MTVTLKADKQRVTEKVLLHGDSIKGGRAAHLGQNVRCPRARGGEHNQGIEVDNLKAEQQLGRILKQPAGDQSTPDFSEFVRKKYDGREM